MPVIRRRLVRDRKMMADGRSLAQTKRARRGAAMTDTMPLSDHSRRQAPGGAEPRLARPRSRLSTRLSRSLHALVRRPVPACAPHRHCGHRRLWAGRRNRRRGARGRPAAGAGASARGLTTFDGRPGLALRLSESGSGEMCPLSRREAQLGPHASSRDRSTGVRLVVPCAQTRPATRMEQAPPAQSRMRSAEAPHRSPRCGASITGVEVVAGARDIMMRAGDRELVRPMGPLQ